MVAVVMIVIVIPLNPDITQQMPSSGPGVTTLGPREMLLCPSHSWLGSTAPLDYGATWEGIVFGAVTVMCESNRAE